MTSFRIDPTSLTTMRRQLDALGVDSAALLREAGMVSGRQLMSGWQAHVAGRGGPDESELVDQRWFGVLLTELLAEMGWGRFVFDQPDGDALVLVSQDGAEAAPDTATAPACHFTAGAFATFLTTLADAPLEVVELECRSAGAPACQFLVGSPETIAAATDLRAAGGEWRGLLGTSERD